MSNTTRWIFARDLIILAIGVTVIALFSGGISMIGCQEVPPD
jgi:hypothetical protein